MLSIVRHENVEQSHKQKGGPKASAVSGSALEHRLAEVVAHVGDHAREGPLERAPRDAPDAAELAEEVILWMIERSKRLDVDTGDVASLLALELISSLAAYNRAPLAVILAAIAEAAPTREALVRDANRLGQRPPPLNVAKLTAIAPDACRLH